MAIIFMDGFEKNSWDQWTNNSGASIASSSGLEMSGSYVLSLPYDHYVEKSLSASYSELYCTFRWRPTNTGQNITVIAFYDTSNNVVGHLIRLSTHKLALYRGGDLLDTGDVDANPNVTYFLKIKYKPLDSGGEFTVWVDGVQDLTYSGDTTNGLENIKKIRLGVVTHWPVAYFDDFVVSTTDITQNLRIAGKAITGAGTTTQWTPSTGANWECVNEIPPSSSDYNATNTVGNIDTFALTDCTETINSIAAVQVEMNGKYAGSPTPTHVQHVIRSNSTNYASGVDKSLPSEFGAPVVHIWATDPQDSGAWTESRVNAIEVGYKATA